MKRGARPSGELMFKPTEEERTALLTALDTAQADPASLRDWTEVHESLQDHR